MDYRKIFLSIIVISFLLSCSKDEEEMESVEPTSQETVLDQAMVGIWEGSASGTYGNANITLELLDNGRAIVTSDSPSYCPIPGLEWFIDGTKFKMEGNDSCDNTLVSFDAPKSTSRLEGRWNASSGANGSFTVSK